MALQLSLRPTEARRQEPRRLRQRDRFDAFPRTRSARWLVRLLFAFPYMLPTMFAMGRADSVDTPNAQLLQHVAQIPWDRADASWLGEIYPPLSTLIAAGIPGGRAGLSIAGAFIAGIFLQKMLEVMVQRRFRPSTAAILLIALAANPLFFYTATENFPAFLGLAFFGLGIADIVRFVAWGNTQSGFRAGMFLMLATLSDLSGLAYVLTAAAAAPFLRLGRHGQRGARGANVLVIVYPTVASLIAVLLLNSFFLGNPIGSVGTRLLAGTTERFESVGPLFQTPSGWLLVASVLSAWLMALIVRRPGSILVSTLVFGALITAFVLGLLPPGSAGNTFIAMTLMAIALIPTPKRRLLVVLMNVVAILQIGIAWTSAFNRDIVVQWMSALGVL
ncbi:MAG TPA: hypothetical protein VNT53_09870 [Pseudolysinimonas sp.]|nr:hypothetical protein [Pseudolysinimonas sp.]